MEIRETKGVRGDIPTWTEPEKVGQRRVGVSRLGGQDGVDRRISVVDSSAVLRGELGQVVLEIVSVQSISSETSSDLVRYDITMPCDQVERAVILHHGHVFAIVLVDDHPVAMQLLVDMRDWIQEISRVRQTMTSQRS